METIKKWEPLYSLDKKGKIRIYDLQVTTDDNEFFIKSCTGLLNGSLIYNTVKAPKGKQGRTWEEQAMFISQSNWNDKRNEGYKSLLDLSLKAQVMEKEIEGLSIEAIFRELEITYNTDTHWYPLPMLAEKYTDCKKRLKFPYIAQPKLNGVRCITLYDADLQQVVQVSRGGKTYDIPYIKNQLEPFFLHNQNVILDGELYCHGRTLQEISGAARKEKDAPAWLEYHIYDVVDTKLSQRERLNKLESFICDIFNRWANSNHNIINTIHRVKYKTVSDELGIELAHEVCVNDGYEGLILRDPNEPYMISFRDKCLIKVKEFEDAEFEIIGSKIDLEKSVGESFCFQLKNDINDKTFYARPMGTIEDKEIWHSKIGDLIGKKCTIRFQERSEDGLPLQAHVRTDKSKCLTIEIVDRNDL